MAVFSKEVVLFFWGIEWFGRFFPRDNVVAASE